jgi:hypothetical protein
MNLVVLSVFLIVYFINKNTGGYLIQRLFVELQETYKYVLLCAKHCASESTPHSSCKKRVTSVGIKQENLYGTRVHYISYSVFCTKFCQNVTFLLNLWQN